ncbi:MAG: DUF3881 family protein [Lachnospiraceae bacterium]|nr:DUF3881 family protein [Lachnospiraceae bacterium]
MHRYLRSIGFSDLKKRKDVNELLGYAIRHASERSYTTTDPEDNVLFSEYLMEVAPGIGLGVRGEFNEDNQFILDYYFPYCRGAQISSYEELSIERHAEKESYAGICDDVKLGVSLIFYLQNVIPYLKQKNVGKNPEKGTSLVLGALSTEGRILLPLEKKESDKKRLKKESASRSKLLDAARNGDEDAMETLTLEEIDTYSNISRMILKQDVLTLVDTYFMPYGIECDQYSILGEIVSSESFENKLTGEKIYLMTLCCNDLYFDVAINEKDLIGEPQAGRRFKGVIWMQGEVNFKGQ